MRVTYELDLSVYTDNEVAMMLVTGVITRTEFERWREERRLQEEEAAGRKLAA